MLNIKINFFQFKHTLKLAVHLANIPPHIVFYLFPETPLIPDTLIFQILSILANTKITYLDRSSCEDIN